MFWQQRQARSDAQRVTALLKTRSNILNFVRADEVQSYLLNIVETEIEQYRTKYQRVTRQAHASDDVMLGWYAQRADSPSSQR